MKERDELLTAKEAAEEPTAGRAHQRPVEKEGGGVGTAVADPAHPADQAHPADPARPAERVAAEGGSAAPDGLAEPSPGKPSGQEEIQTPAAARLEAELERLLAERDQLRDRMARMQAEFENAKKRAEKERAEFREFAAAAVVEKFLPVLDNFELALKSTGSAEQLRSGVELIVKQMEEIMKSLHVVPVATVGEPFDPHVHEALGTVERDDLPDHTVAEEIRRGYKVHGRLLRPAMVKVVSNPKQSSEQA